MGLLDQNTFKVRTEELEDKIISKKELHYVLNYVVNNIFLSNLGQYYFPDDNLWSIRFLKMCYLEWRR